MADTATLVSAEEFLLNPDYEGWELLDGQPKERCMGVQANMTTATVLQDLGNHVDLMQVGGLVGPEQRYRLWPDRPHLIRKPDVSYFSPGRDVDLRAGELTVAPDLAVEVISLRNDAEDVERKRVQFLEAGVRMIWILYPATQTLYLYTPDSFAILSGDDVLDGGEVVPGFCTQVSRFFRRG